MLALMKDALDLGWPEIAGVNFHHHLTGLLINTFFINARASPPVTESEEALNTQRRKPLT
jgi:hypothetical protein